MTRTPLSRSKGQLVADVLNSQYAGKGATWRMNAKILSTCRGRKHIMSPRAQLVANAGPNILAFPIRHNRSVAGTPAASRNTFQSSRVSGSVDTLRPKRRTAPLKEQLRHQTMSVSRGRRRRRLIAGVGRRTR